MILWTATVEYMQLVWLCSKVVDSLPYPFDDGYGIILSALVEIHVGTCISQTTCQISDRAVSRRLYPIGALEQANGCSYKLKMKR